MFQSRLRTLVLGVALSFATAAYAANPRLVLPDFRALESKASETVNITLDPSLIGLAARFLDPGDPQDAAARDVITGLTGIYVRSFKFDTDVSYPQGDVDGLHKQLAAPGWLRLIQVHSRKEHTDVDVYLSLDGNRANGLALIAVEPRQVTVVNIVGSVDLQKLHQLEGRFGIPKLKLEDSK